MESYIQFCYKPVLPLPWQSDSEDSTVFTFWANGDFDPCIEYALLMTGSSALFGLCSALYSGSYTTRASRKLPARIFCLRILISLLIMALFLIQFIGSFWLAKGRPYSVLLTQCVLIISWAVHIYCLWVLAYSIKQHGRGPLTLHCAWFLTFLSSIFRFHSVIAWNNDKSNYTILNPFVSTAYFSLSSQITTYVYFGLQLLYLFTLPFKTPKVTGDSVKIHKQKYLSTQFEDPSARQQLINTDNRSYGTINTWPQVSVNLKETCEDKANPLSLLSFWWVHPLMKRGSLGLLQTPNNLPKLPSMLETNRVRDKFKEIVQKNVLSNSNWTLVRNLNSAFGGHYYPLGILKLLADLLSFSGPLLLHQLVAFIENKKVSTIPLQTQCIIEYNYICNIHVHVYMDFFSVHCNDTD